MYLKLKKSYFDVLDRLTPFLVLTTVISFIIGSYFALYESPPDYIQGDSMRIMYVHVPSAWWALMSYSVLAVSCTIWFITRNPIFNLIAKSIAPIGAVFTIIALVTGSIWGKPTWGVWWVWDARLTSMLLLLFLYLAYIFLWQAISNKDLASKISAALAMIGFINVPIIKFSVDWWNTLHQPASISKFSSPSIDESMLIPLFIMAFASLCFLITIFSVRLRIEFIETRISRLRQKIYD